jgi:hypothetical protein
MDNFFSNLIGDAPKTSPTEVAIRLVLALVLGGCVAWVYRRTRLHGVAPLPSFCVTLVLLSVLIAMVTQVIGDNVARAFSLVGALSIVRFRTVVRDTQDTAYVIFAVVVGMAVGAHDLWVACIGIAVVGPAAWVMSRRWTPEDSLEPHILLNLRVPLGTDLPGLLGVAQDCLRDTQLVSVATTKQGLSLEATYEARLRAGRSPEELLKRFNEAAGVQRVEIRRRGFVED